MTSEPTSDQPDRTPKELELKTRPGVNAKRNLKGHITEGREAWVTVKPFELIIFNGDEEDWAAANPTKVGETDSIKIELRQPNRRAFKVDLTGMTAAELHAVAAVLKMAFDMALPVCEELDKKAKEAFEAGDDTYARLYRPDPLIFIREYREDGKRVAVPMEVQK